MRSFNLPSEEVSDPLECRDTGVPLLSARGGGLATFRCGKIFCSKALHLAIQSVTGFTNQPQGGTS